MLALSGGGRALTQLDGVSRLWTTGYGRTILVKSALFAGLLVLGFVGRQRLASAMRLPERFAELALVVALVGAVAVLGAAPRSRRRRRRAARGPAGARTADRPAPGGLVLGQ